MKQVFLLFLLFTYTTELYSQCTGDITLLTQTDIDDFVIDYGCSTIEGNLSIGESPGSSFYSIDDLLGLETITSIEGSLTIISNDITNLEGLDNLNSIGGNLKIWFNGELTSIEALQNLNNIGGLLEFNGNNELTNLNGLENITHLGAINLTFNDKLVNIEALQNLTTIGGDLKLHYNEVLSSLQGLHNVTTVGGTLQISGNHEINSIEVFQNLSSIGSLKIENNDALINLNGLENITNIEGYLRLWANDGLLNLEGLENLTNIGGTLTIGHNDLITNIDPLQNLNNIGTTLWIYNNISLSNIEALQNITSLGNDLDISSNDALFNLEGLNNLTSIGGTVRISYSEFTNLAELANLTSVGGILAISSSPHLISLNGLQNITTIGENLAIFNNSSLEICCDILPILDAVQGEVSLQTNLPTCNSVEVITNFCNSQEIQSIAFFDENENGLLDENEQTIYQSFSLEPSALHSFSDQTGVAYFYLVDLQEYELYLNNSNPLWEFTGINTSIQISYLDSTFSDSLHFFPMNITTDIVMQSVDLSSSITRCNQNTNYWLTYTNEGTTTNNGYIELIPDELTNFVSANPPADSTAGNTLYWFYENLYPTHSKQIHLVYQMPGVEAIGEQINFEANIETDEGNGDDKSTISSELVCAYDPNDKLVFPTGEGIENYTVLGDTLEYTIRFQNTGNDTAFTVVVEDKINQHLDLNSFRTIATSHNVATQIDIDARIATFTFNDIYLPDSFVNEPASHGFVKFQIQGNEGLSNFTSIENKAEILFDSNPPIVTNTVLNTFTETIPSVFLGKVFLEGCYEGNQEMSSSLFLTLPFDQPFGNAPYHHAGNEGINGVSSTMVDWILVEARTGTPNINGTPGTTVVEQIAGILLEDGNIVNTSRTTGVRFLNLEQGTPYYFSIRHLNHLDILSATPINASATMSYDFSLAPDMAFGIEQQKLSDDGTPLLFAGDANGDGVILNTDYDLWFLDNAVLNTYSPTDWNLDGTIQVTDYDLWFLNKAKVGIVELQD